MSTVSTLSSIDQIRQRLGDRYVIERELGRGGMGAVYLARDIRLDRLVALKVLPPEFAADAALRERFLRETRTAASFSHPNIVPVHAVEEREDVLAFAMGFVEGESLAQRVRRSGPLGVREIVRMLQDIGYALANAHGRGVVHRDIKPDNIMIERATGRALLMDFGISRTITSAVATQGLTRIGEVVGTPEYMSPEQASGDVVDGRSDIYSLGLVAFFAATGRVAITGDTTQKILVKQITEPVAPIAGLRGDLPAALAAAIDRCTAKAPEERFPTAESLVETIDDAQLAAPEIPLPVRLFSQELGTLSLVLVFLTVLGWMMARSIGKTASSLDSLLPVIVLVGVALTRILQVLQAARRLTDNGFSSSEVLKGMHAVVGEREAMREQLRADPDVQRRRRTTLTMATLQVPLALVLLYFALVTRTRVGETYNSGVGGITMLVTGLMLVGVSMVLFARSPFRMPIGERLFRRVWLGPLGRGFLRLAARSARRQGAATATIPRTAPRAVAVAPNEVPSTVTKRSGDDSTEAVAELRQRVAALERWRESTE